MTTLPFMRWFPGDYAADTPHLDRAQHGSYRLLLDAMWMAGGKLPRDPMRLARIAKCTEEEWEADAPVLMEFFLIRGPHIYQKRLGHELNRSRRFAEAQREKGRASAAKRAQKPTESKTGNENNGNSPTPVEPSIPILREDKEQALSTDTDLSGESSRNNIIQFASSARGASSESPLPAADFE